MKTADKIKCESREIPDNDPGHLTGTVLVENHQEGDKSSGSINFEDNRIAIRTLGGDNIQVKEMRTWDDISETFKALVDNANDGICVVLENMYHAYVNKKYCEITGYSNNELEKIRIVDLILPEERRAFWKAHRLSFHDETNLETNCIATVIKKGGKRCCIECSESKIVWKGKPGIQMIIRDITVTLEKEKMFVETNKHLSNQIDNITARLITSSEMLKQKQSELVRHKFELENVNKELLQTNRAMSFLAQNIAKKKKEVEQKVAHTVLTKINPILNDLKKKKALQNYITEIEVLCVYVNGLASEADQYNKILANLSATEMRIVTLIKKGMSSQSIADALNISIETVKTHRKKIRRKLEVKNTDTNLTSYLRSVMVDS